MQKTSKRVLALVLTLMMVLSLFTAAASAYDITYQSTTHTVFKHTEQTLAPGITQDIFHAYQTSDGAQNIYYVFTADINRDDVLVQGSYKDAQASEWGMQRLTEQMAAANAKYSDPSNPDFISEYYTAIAGTNGDFYNISTGRPSGALAINGTVANSANNRPWFAILKDGTAKIGYGNSDWPGNENVKEAVGGSQVIVWEGQDSTATASGSYNTGREPRTAIGIKADGSVVSMVLDGRQDPVSSGGSMHEIAQIMLEAGCEYAINLDGGGSSTFAARQAGSDTVEVINHPSDNSERAISSGVIIASLTPPSDVFDRAVLTPEDEYITPGTSTGITVTGVSPAGSSAEVPAEVTYDVRGGSFDGSTFTSDGTECDATIIAEYQDEVVGSTTIHVVIPDAISFTQSTITVPLGKTVDIGLSASYGVYDVKSKASDYTITNTIGTVDGFAITAPADAAVLTGTITAVLNADNNITASADLSFGKGSVVLFDFEDQTKDLEWVDLVQNASYNMSIESGYVTEETGRVYNGSGALGIHADFSEDNETRWAWVGLRNNGDDIVIPADAKTFGFWLYVPKEAVGFEIDLRPYELQANGTWKRVTITNYENGWASTLQEDGWHYYSFDIASRNELRLPGAPGKSVLPSVNTAQPFFQLYNDMGDDNDTYGFDFSDYANAAGDFYFYVDDMSIDFSTAADDREPPVFGNFSYATQTMADASVIAKGAVPTVTDNHLDFTAKVAEDTAKSNYTGIDASTAKAYIDGVEVDAFYQNGSIATASTATLADGVHTVKFTICDKQGNYASSIRQINVNAGSDIDTINVVLNAGDDTYVKLGQLCSIDLVATDITKVNSVTAQFQLNTKTTWELDHMTVADGFTADYSVRDDNNVATVTITREGYTPATRGGNEAVLASLPIRAWTTPYESTYKQKSSYFRTDVSFDTLYGLMESADGDVSFSAARQAKDTEVYASFADMAAADRTKAWHVHDPHAVEDKAPTCTEAGYTGRTFCDNCNSVVDWGSDVAATGHIYAEDNRTYKFVVNDGNGNQSADLTYAPGLGYYNGGTYESADIPADTVVFTLPANWSQPLNIHYFTTDGQIGTEWPGVAMEVYGQNDYNETLYSYKLPLHLMRCTGCGQLCNEVVGGKQYFDGAAANGFADGKYYIDGVVQPYTGIVEVEGFYYEFDENNHTDGKYTGIFEKDGKLYNSQFGELTTGWKYIDGKYYYFEENSKAAYADTTVAINAADEFYTFDENGVLTAGSFTERDGHTVYHWAGDRVKRQFFDIDGETYYFDFRGWMVTGFVGIEQGSFAHANDYYVFNADGTLVKEPGLTFACDGTVCVLGDDYKAVYAGMVQDGNDYYYINSSLKAVKDCDYLCLKTNGLMPADSYHFDADGKLVLPEAKNGIVEENGALYLYVDGEKLVNAHLVEFEGNYYYVRSSGQLAVGDYLVWEGNGIVPDKTTHHFDADGKMNDPEPPVVEPKNGVEEENGALYLYVDGEKLVNAHLVEFDGAYYYVRSSGQLAVGDYLVWEGNGIVPDKTTHHFDDDGKMNDPEPPVVEPKNGIFEENGSLYLYLDDVKQVNTGLVEYDGAYYYVRSAGQLAVGDYLVWSGNGIVPDKTTHHFEADGKMNDPEPPVVEPKNGVYEENGSLYLYIDGEKLINAHLVEYDGAYYYVRSGGQLAVGDYLVWSGNGIVPDMTTHHFDDDGKMNDPSLQ